MIKLLIVNGHLNIGGVEKSLVDLLNSMNYKKYQVDLLLFEGCGDYLEQIPKGVNIIECDLRPVYGSSKKIILESVKEKNYKKIILKSILTLRSKIGVEVVSLFKFLRLTKKRYDCAIAYRPGICADYVGFCVKANKKLMWWHHGTWDYDDKTLQEWKITLNKIDEIICVSDSTKKMISNYFTEKRGNISVIPNMICVNDIKKKGEMFNPYQEDIKENDIIIVSVGRFSYEKKMTNVLYVVDKLLENGITNIKWYMVGDGAERQHVDSEILKRDLQSKIICVGNKSNPYPYMRGADLYVHPSYVESQGLTILEAMALNVPCVVTKSRGPCEFIQDRVNGILVEQNPEALFQGVKEIIRNQSLYEYIKKNTMCPGKYSRKSIMEKFENVIRG